MGARIWDSLETDLAELIFDQAVAVRRAIPMVCRAHPNASVHYLVLALASAASSMQETWPIEDRLNQRNLLDLHTAVAAVASDIALHGLTGQRCATCADLLAYWRTQHDQYFAVHDLA